MRASRLVSVLLLLQNRGRMTAAELAEELEVSVRTVYRDLESLAAAGVPVYAEHGPAGGYQLVDGYRTRLTGLTGQEADSLFLAGLPGPAAQLGLGAELAAARLKLEAALSPELRARARRIRERFHLDAPSWFRPAEETPQLTALAEAVWNQRRVRMRYQGWNPAVPAADRELDPLGVVCKAGQWYLVGDAGDRPRTYRVSRIQELTVLPDRFDRPADFDLAEFWADWAREFEARMYTGEMVVRLAPNVFRLLSVVWNPVPAEAAMRAQRAEPPDADGWRRAVIPIESERHALVDVLKLGALIEVVEPLSLRARVAEAARATAGRYMCEADAMTTTERFEVRRDVAAAPAKVFALLCDPQGHVTIDSSGMLQSAEGNPVRQVGDQFIVHMDREALNDYPLGKYDVTVIITQFEQDTHLEWTISGTIQPPIKHLYGYRLEPSERGTLVTSYYDWSQIEERYRERGIFPVIPEAALRATLGILARNVER